MVAISIYCFRMIVMLCGLSRSICKITKKCANSLPYIKESVSPPPHGGLNEGLKRDDAPPVAAGASSRAFCQARYFFLRARRFLTASISG
ncbi:MAG: hypothetical protein K2J18_05940, partial [Paramuribaculum sp.]|nr:hypothetical protein [Paramuribaculum sp.]